MHHFVVICEFKVMAQKRLSWVLTSVTLTFDLWPWPFTWPSLPSLIITPDNFILIRWREHSQKGVTDRQAEGQTDRWTDWTIHRAAWSQLKNEWAVNTTASVCDNFDSLMQDYSYASAWEMVLLKSSAKSSSCLMVIMRYVRYEILIH